MNAQEDLTYIKLLPDTGLGGLVSGKRVFRPGTGNLALFSRGNTPNNGLAAIGNTDVRS
jgi:hypothetical protein